ncbi:M15 family metallopeptidase [Agromyces sp. LHK192]|uniref:M15 family metallopeptidase n=1 Tax=Agromyces sp. LHK192 TaxID=2498704 RepID=UPI000FD7F967|nr:M15 family metallopeptidase [Agromyces sp. LHK192]
MQSVRSIRPTRARPILLLLIALVAAAVLGAVLIGQAAADSSPSSVSGVPGAPPDGTPPDRTVPDTASGSGSNGDDDGRVPDGTTVFDDGAALANLDPDLLDAVRRAATDAAADGVSFVVNSGWRSAEYQGRLLDEAIAEYGSSDEAARWVATAETSPHVHGDAIDLGPWEALDWLAQHGDDYGLCQVYANEPWHYELRPDAVGNGCPAQYPDPTHDPRMQG